MSRNQWVLAGLLAAQLLLLLVVGGPMARSQGPAEAQPLFPGLEAYTPAKLEIQSGEDRVTLVRDGEEWGLEEADGYPAQADKLDKLPLVCVVASSSRISIKRPSYFAR